MRRGSFHYRASGSEKVTVAGPGATAGSEAELGPRGALGSKGVVISVLYNAGPTIGTPEDTASLCGVFGWIGSL